MVRSTLRPFFLTALIAGLAGCAGMPAKSEPAEGATAEKTDSAAAETPAVDPKRAAVPAEAVADKPALDPTARREERVAATVENAKLLAQVNEMSRELAAARATNARLRAERGRGDAAESAPAAAAKPDPTDDKLASSLKSYAALKSELAGIFAEIERLRAENAKAKEAVARTDDARAALAKLEAELRAEKRSRAEAEQAVAKLQEQLRAIARALSSAGLSVEKLAAGDANR